MNSIDPLSHLFRGKSFELFVEIGVRYGDSTVSVLNSADITRYVGIDPYEQYEQYEHDGSYSAATDDTYTNVVINKLSKYSNYEHIRMYSSDAAMLFEDESIDFLFVDGNHSYEYVLKDLELYYPKVKSGGIIAGDDYFICEENFGRKMVQEAVDEFASKIGQMPRLSEFKHRGYPKDWWFVK